jgi:hypothetical protein
LGRFVNTPVTQKKENLPLPKIKGDLTMNLRRKNIVWATFAALAIIAGLDIKNAHAYADINFLDLSNRQSVSGVVESRITVNDSTAQRAEYFLDGINGTPILASSTPPYFYVQWNTQNVTPGFHTFGVQVYSSTGTIGSSYLIVYVSTPSPTCPDTTIEVRTYTSSEWTGGFWGAGFGSAGFYADPNTIKHVGLPAGLPGSTFNLEVHPSYFGDWSHPASFSCSYPIHTGANGCPDARPIVAVTDTSCWIYTGY